MGTAGSCLSMSWNKQFLILTVGYMNTDTLPLGADFPNMVGLE